MPTLVQRSSTRPTAASRRLRIVLAVLGALLLHVAFLLLLAWGLPHWPRPPIRKGREPIQLTIEPAGTPTPEPSGPSDTGVARQPDYMRTIDEQKSDTPPPDPSFISDKDTLAASEKPATDPNKPLPTQDGREMAAYDFDTTPYRPGQEASSAASAAAPSEAAPPAPTPAKEKTPDAKKPKPDSKEKPTPRPPTVQPTPSPGEFASLKPDPNPSDEPPKPQETPPPDANATPPPPQQDALARQAARVARENSSVTSTGLPQKPGYQPQSVQSKMSGSVNNRGRPAVSALGTPLGRYEKAVSDAIGQRWYYIISQNMGNLIHTEDVKIHFYVSRTGRIVGARVNGRNETTVLANLSLQAVTEAELPPIPSEVAAALPDGQLEVDYTFGLYEQ